MIIKKIKFHNFRNFYGDQEIEFAYNDNKNVTVILGENAHGKTNLLGAFNWCFYGESRLENEDDILNHIIRDEMIPNQQETVSVEVDFIDNDIPYTIKRTNIYEYLSNKVKLKNNNDNNAILYYKDINGNNQKLIHKSDINEVIYTILPKDLSEFFFFQGEKNNDLTRRDLKKAVNTLLGLAPFNKMLEHLYGTTDNIAEKSVIAQITKKCSELGGEDTQELQNEINELSNDLDIINNRLKEITNEKNNANNRISEIDIQLKAYQETRVLQEKRSKLEATIEKDYELLNNLYNSLIKAFNNDALGYIMNSSFEKVNKRLNKSNLPLNDNALNGIDGTCIKELLKRGKCLCGQTLKPGTEHYKLVEQYIDILPPQSLGIIIKNLLDEINRHKSNQSDFIFNFEKCYKEILDKRLNLDKTARDIADVNDEIMSLGNPDIGALENERRNLQNSLNDLDDDFKTKIQKQSDINSDIKEKQAKLNDKLSKDEKARKYKRYLDYAYAVYDWLKDAYQTKEDDMRNELEFKIRELFGQMYTGHRDVSIDENYNIIIKHKGDNLADTGGLKTIKYFAYVAGVVALANNKKLERAKDNDNIFINSLGEEYPLVLDAAFSHTDTEHTKNISKTLSNNSTQLIFAMMEKDWENAQQGLENKIGKLYRLVRLNKLDEDKIEIRREEYGIRNN